MESESISLRLKNGSSDKTYNVSLEPSGAGWVVNFSYGKTGGTLTAGTKTRAPVAYDAAKEAYDKLVSSKTAKGYSPGGDGVAFSGTELAGRVTSYQPQLLNPVSEDAMIDMVSAAPGAWIAQEKHDGERRGLKVAGGEIIPSNRKGLRVPVRGETEEAVARLAAMGLEDFEIDCEIMGPKLVAFDVLMLDGDDLRDMPLKQRLEKLGMLDAMFLKAGVESAITTSPSWELDSAATASNIIATMRAKSAEGVVFKKSDATYQPGRPNSGGDQLKLKFYNDATVRVAAANDKRSVAIELLDGAEWVKVGNVTIPPSDVVPPQGSLIEVKYLYAYKGGALYQPQYLGQRNDVEEAECTLAQLIYKAEAA